MRIGVLAAESSWHFQDLQRAASAGQAIEPVPFPELCDELTETDHWLRQCDCLLTRSMPAGSLQQVIFRMDVLLRLEKMGVRIVNPPRSVEMAVDKYLSLARLVEAGVAVPPTAVSQEPRMAMEHFERLGGDVVVKPLFGSQGRGLERISSQQLAQKRFSEIASTGEVIYQQSFIPHDDFDLRVFIIGSRFWAMKRVNPDHWISNLAQGAIGQPHQITLEEVEIAQRAATAIKAQIAGIDLLVDQRNGRLQVVEVNSAPSWRGISQVLGVDFAREILDYLERVTVLG